jgi:6,7-dimethyl-8-ribityllumazine synthase
MHKLEFSVESLSFEPRIGIIVSRFHKEISDGLLSVCEETLKEYGVKEVGVFEIPGAFETPLTAKKLAESGKFDCLITLGAVIKGDTQHFELVTQECTRGIMDVMLETGVPIIYEVLATNTLAQAKERASGEDNKGKEAALSALKLLSTLSTHNLL